MAVSRLTLYSSKVYVFNRSEVVFTKTTLCANRRRTLKYVKLSRRNVLAMMHIKKELRNKALALSTTFLTK